MRARLVLAVGFVLFASTAVRAQIQPLFVIPTESRVVATIPDGADLRIALESNDVAALAKRLGAQIVGASPSFEYVVGAYPQLEGDASRTWLEPTFMIDFDQPEFTGVRAELAEFGSKPTRAQLIGFVNRTVDETVRRGWDFASTVAKKRQGDCSEHAVFTAALARMYGTPARVVIGITLIAEGNEYRSYGHAWAEMLEDGKWVVADAALLDVAPNARYLPLGLVEEEGMGFKMSLAALSSQWIQKLTVLGPAK